ncbi:MAG: hypothetical protein ACJ73D_13255 [Pyrinomonadaceae bacterium]
MLERIFPRSLDNDYRGWRTGLWLFGLVVAMKSLQSVAIIFNSWTTVRDADGMPLDTYSPEASANLVAIFAQSSLWRLTVCTIAVVVLIRYRSAVAVMFLAFIANYLAAQLLNLYHPLIKTGTPPGPWVNLAIFIVMVAGYVLAVLRQPRAKA